MLVWIPLYVKYFGTFNSSNGECWKIVHHLHNNLGISYEEISQLN